MTHSEVMSQPTEETSRQAPLRSGNKRGTLALLLSVIALGLLFYPAIRQGVITVAGPQRWLPAQLPYVSRLPAGPDAKLLAADLALYEAKEKYQAQPPTMRLPMHIYAAFSISS